MSSHGIKDRVAIVGMGCTRFAEHWDKGLDEMVIDATDEAFASAAITKDDVDAYWLGTAQSGMSGITLARPLQLVGKPVTRVENYCATGAAALRQAAYAVAKGVEPGELKRVLARIASKNHANKAKTLGLSAAAR